MRALVLGGAGFIGSRLVDRLLRRPQAPGMPSLDQLLVTDLRPPREPWPQRSLPELRFVAGDLLDPSFIDTLFAQPVHTIFHLAAALTFDAETDFVRGLELNVRALMRVLERCRQQGGAPRLVFASSVSSFGGVLPDVVDDFTHQTPQTSYGVHKVIAEQLINDYSRRGFVDGRVLRLPIVLTRPGPPSASVSDRIAALIREPLDGRDTVCPLAPDTRIAVASVDKVVDALLGLHALPSSVFGATRATNLPSLTVTPAQLVQAVAQHASTRALGRVLWQPDEIVQRVVDGWPKGLASALAQQHGIAGDASADALVSAYLDARYAGA